jgi:hypothetical protein
VNESTNKRTPRNNKVPSSADNLADIPPVAAYKAAFLGCRGPKHLTPQQLKMLKLHYEAPDRTVTAGELASGVGFRTYSAANLQYGTYAGRLCSLLGRTPSFQLAILAQFSAGDQPGLEFVKWTMLPHAARALEELGWVRKRD